MRPSVLALFRSPDASSLGWALSLLLALNVFVAGLHLGDAGGAPSGIVLCALDQTRGGSAPSPATHQEPCCFAGCVSSVVGPAPAPEAVARAPALPVETLRPHLATLPPAVTPDRISAPRGPPVLA